MTRPLNIETTIPIPSVMAKPLITPEPRKYSTIAAIRVVTLPSTIADVALLYPSLMEERTVLPVAISSRIRVKMMTFASTAIPTERMIPAIPGRVSVISKRLMHRITIIQYRTSAIELAKPGRDPRDELPKPLLRADVLDINDLKEGMTLKGTVRNVIDFGAFVDIGVHQDGLVHISEMCDRFIKHPSEVVKVGDIVDVKILSIDTKKNRISLTMKL